MPATPAPALAWFGGRLATGLLEVRHDAAALDEAGWWAVVMDFEGALTCARFAEVGAAPLPQATGSWPDLARGWRSSLARGAYLDACREVRERIGRGQVYQVNVCRVLEHALPAGADLIALAGRLAAGNPSPYGGVLRLPGVELVSASPELFLAREGDVVTTGPIKGTAATADLLLPKDEHENVMIVDLARHDLSGVCRPGTVEVVDLLAVEAHPGLVHLVSRVRGELRAGVRWPELLTATSPAASVTGAPKWTALQAIRDLEPVPRGPYCGAVGWVDADAGRAELAVGIRTFWTVGAGQGRLLRFGTGAGITWGSDPAGEWDETELKAQRLLALASGTLPG